MDKNIRIAKELVKLAKSLVAAEEGKGEGEGEREKDFDLSEIEKDLLALGHKINVKIGEYIKKNKNGECPGSHIMNVVGSYTKELNGLIEYWKRKKFIDDEKYNKMMTEAPGKKGLDENIQNLKNHSYKGDNIWEDLKDNLVTWCYNIVSILKGENY